MDYEPVVHIIYNNSSFVKRGLAVEVPGLSLAAVGQVLGLPHPASGRGPDLLKQVSALTHAV